MYFIYLCVFPAFRVVEMNETTELSANPKTGMGAAQYYQHLLNSTRGVRAELRDRFSEIKVIESLDVLTDLKLTDVCEVHAEEDPSTLQTVWGADSRLFVEYEARVRRATDYKLIYEILLRRIPDGEGKVLHEGTYERKTSSEFQLLRITATNPIREKLETVSVHLSVSNYKAPSVIYK